MGLADVIQMARESEDKTAGERLFEYSRVFRGYNEVEPMQVGDLVRASSLPYLCPREEVLAHRYDVMRARHNEPMLQITLDIGHAFHDLYRDVYYGPMGEWVGSWKCMMCGWDTDRAGLSKPPETNNGCTSPGVLTKMPEKCGNCHAPFIVHPGSGDGYRGNGTFNEWHIEDKGIGVKGHPDGWVARPRVRRLLVDLKSHGHRGFASRRKLRDGHDLQAWAYQFMCGDEAAEVWYLNKSPWGDHAAFVKTVPVEFDKKGFRQSVLSPVERTLDGLAGGPLPERMCVSVECPRAKECQLSSICFFC